MHKKCRNVKDLGNSVQHWIHVVVKFLLLYSRSLHVFNCSINVNFACLLKLWPGNQKCCLAWSKFCLFTCFWWLFSLKLKVVSDLPVYCLFHSTHSIRYTRHLLLELSLLYILKVLCVTVRLKVFVDCICVHHRFFNLELQVFE